MFRKESQARPNDPKAVHPIDEHALASRLSFFLWSSTPDEQLLRLADSGQLRANLDDEVERLLRDGKASALTRNFAGQWLQLRNLDLVSPDPKTYQGWNRNLREAMRNETEMFFGAVLKERPQHFGLFGGGFHLLE